jgi:hypothetical protein
MEHRSTELMNPRNSVEPKYFYCSKTDTDQLLRTSLLTGEGSSHQIAGYQFKFSCCLSELPGGNLLITGGGNLAVGEVVKIDTLRECAVSSLNPMLTARQSHAAVTP